MDKNKWHNKANENQDMTGIRTNIYERGPQIEKKARAESNWFAKTQGETNQQMWWN